MAHMSDARLDGRLLDAAWDFADPVGSETRLRSLRDELGVASLAGMEVTTQIARALGLQGRFGEAQQLLDGVVDGDTIVGARLALERGRLLNSSGDPGAAIPWFRAGVRLAEAGGDGYLVVDGLHMLAIVESDHCADWTTAALLIVASSSDPRVQRWAGALHNNLGWHLHDAGDLDGALGAFESALMACERTGTLNQVHIARWTVARCLRSLWRLEEALAIQQRLRRDDEPDAFVDEEIAILEELKLRSGE